MLSKGAIINQPKFTHWAPDFKEEEKEAVDVGNDSTSNNVIGVDGQFPWNDDAYDLVADYSEPFLLNVILTCLYSAVLVIVIVANIITIWYFFSNRSSPGLVVNIYVFSLVFADMTWPIFNVPHSVIQLWVPSWFLGSIMCRIMPVVQMAYPQVITLNLSMIAIERYYTVLNPFSENPLSRKKTMLIGVSLFWLVPLLMNIWLVAAYETTIINGHTFCVATNFMFLSPVTINTVKTVQSALMVVVVPLFILPYCYGRIIYYVFESNEESHFAVDFNRRLASEHRRRNVTFFSLLVLSIHFICWLPISAFQLYHAFLQYPPLEKNDIYLYKIFMFLAAANPACNSLLYTAVLRNEIGYRRSRAASNVSTFALLSALANRTRSMAVQLVKYEDNTLHLPRSRASTYETSPTTAYNGTRETLFESHQELLVSHIQTSPIQQNEAYGSVDEGSSSNYSPSNNHSPSKLSE